MKNYVKNIRTHRNEDGFSIVEVLVAISLSALFAVMTLNTTLSQFNSQKTMALEANASDAVSAVANYLTQHPTAELHIVTPTCEGQPPRLVSGIVIAPRYEDTCITVHGDIDHFVVKVKTKSFQNGYTTTYDSLIMDYVTTTDTNS